MQLHRLPLDIAEAERNLAGVAKDIAKRDAHADDEFAMTVGNRVYSGKGAREESAKALTYAILSWRDDTTLQARGTFRGFEILSKGRLATGFSSEDDHVPDIFIREQGHTPLISIPRIPLARCRALSIRCDRSKELPRNNRSAPTLSKRCLPITRLKQTVPLSMTPASRNCFSDRSRSMRYLTLTKVNDR